MNGPRFSSPTDTKLARLRGSPAPTSRRLPGAPRRKARGTGACPPAAPARQGAGPITAIMAVRGFWGVSRAIEGLVPSCKRSASESHSTALLGRVGGLTRDPLERAMAATRSGGVRYLRGWGDKAWRDRRGALTRRSVCACCRPRATGWSGCALGGEFEAFRAKLEAALPRADRSRGGRPPWNEG